MFLCRDWLRSAGTAARNAGSALFSTIGLNDKSNDSEVQPIRLPGANNTPAVASTSRRRSVLEREDDRGDSSDEGSSSSGMSSKRRRQMIALDDSQPDAESGSRTDGDTVTRPSAQPGSASIVPGSDGMFVFHFIFFCVR